MILGNIVTKTDNTDPIIPLDADIVSLGGPPWFDDKKGITNINSNKSKRHGDPTKVRIREFVYTLADGQEGQIMYLVPYGIKQEPYEDHTILYGKIKVKFENFWGSVYGDGKVKLAIQSNKSFTPFKFIQNADSNLYSPRVFVTTCIFMNGAWAISV